MTKSKFKSNVLVMIMVIICMLSTTVFAMDLTASTTQMGNALEDYFAERELEYYGSKVAQIGNVDVEKQERMVFIDSWLDNLNISVAEVDIEYTVVETLSETSSTSKVKVYEWVWIDYVCDGYETVERMGFGTDHILNIAAELGKMTVISDSYSEITGYETGNESDLATLRQSDEILLELSDESIQEMQINQPMANAGGYNHALAGNYSDIWCGNSVVGTSSGGMNPQGYNPQYYYYIEADCCNFVSQCLAAGGMVMSGDWSATLNTSGIITADTDYSKSNIAWRYVPYFVSYWENQGYEKRRITDTTAAGAGNPIFWLKSDGYATNHIMLIVGANSNGNVLVNAHNSDAYHYPIDLSDHIYYTFWF